MVVATGAVVGLGVGLAVAVVAVVDGTALSVGVGLLVDVDTGMAGGVEAGAGSAVDPIATRVTSEPTTEAGTTTFFGNRETVGGLIRDRPNPVCQSATAIHNVTGQKGIAARPMTMPTHSRLRLPG